jgi:hypothetical protein
MVKYEGKLQAEYIYHSSILFICSLDPAILDCVPEIAQCTVPTIYSHASVLRLIILNHLNLRRTARVLSPRHTIN